MALPDDIVERIRQAADIVQIVGRYVELRKGGRDFMGCCPFHNEKTPSFSVSPSKRFFYCFGCHASGDVFTFVMKHEGLDFNEAKRKLGEWVGIEVSKESPQERRRKEAEALLVSANTVAHRFFMEQLWDDASKRPRHYLEQRGIPLRYAREIKMGYGGTSAAFFDYLEKNKISTEMAFKAGLLADSQERCLFDGKVVFPIFSDGKLTGFGGRRIGDGNGPKYINTRESPIFQKGHLLYGWDDAQEALRRNKRAVVVEGYTDVLACHQNGIQEAMAALGTSFTAEHAKRIKRLVTNKGQVVLVLDGDKAGMRASRSASITLLNSDLKPYVAGLPPGEDPDSFIRKMGKENLQKKIEEAKPAVEYFMDTAFSNPEMSVEERSNAAASLAPLLAAISSGLERDLYQAQLAEKVGVTPEQLRRHLDEEVRKQSAKKKKTSAPNQRSQPIRLPAQNGPPPGWDDIPPPMMGGPPPTNNTHPYQAVRAQEPQPPPRELPQKRELEALRELLLYRELRPRLEELGEYAQTEAMTQLLDEMSEPEKSLEEVLRKHLPAAQVSALLKVEPADLDDGPDREELASRTFDDVMRRFKWQCLKLERDEAQRELQSTEKAGEDTTQLLEQKRRLSLLMRELELRK